MQFVGGGMLVDGGLGCGVVGRGALDVRAGGVDCTWRGIVGAGRRVVARVTAGVTRGLTAGITAGCVVKGALVAPSSGADDGPVAGDVADVADDAGVEMVTGWCEADEQLVSTKPAMLSAATFTRTMVDLTDIVAPAFMPPRPGQVITLTTSRFRAWFSTERS